MLDATESNIYPTPMRMLLTHVFTSRHCLVLTAAHNTVLLQLCYHKPSGKHISGFYKLRNHSQQQSRLTALPSRPHNQQRMPKRCQQLARTSCTLYSVQTGPSSLEGIPGIASTNWVSAARCDTDSHIDSISCNEARNLHMLLLLPRLPGTDPDQ